jgi:hypothetical protein
VDAVRRFELPVEVADGFAHVLLPFRDPDVEREQAIRIATGPLVRTTCSPS